MFSLEELELIRKEIDLRYTVIVADLGLITAPAIREQLQEEKVQVAQLLNKVRQLIRTKNVAT